MNQTSNASSDVINVTIWNEFRHEKNSKEVADIYPDGIHATIAEFLGSDKQLSIRTATLDEAENGLPEDVIESTDVLLWWGHMAHGEVSDEVVDRVHRRVLEGMGFIALHSAHYAKPFKKLLGTTCSLKWREASDKERLWNVMPSHPILKGVPDYFEIPMEEMYGEPFGIPTPEELLLISWFTGGEVFRSCATWTRGHGKIVYFRPGHETYPSYHQSEVQTVIRNATHWAAQRVRIPDDCPNTPALEALPDDPNAESRSTTGYY